MGVCGNVCCVAAVVENSGFLSLGVLKYVVCLCRGCDNIFFCFIFLSTSLVPIYIVVSPNGLLEYCFLHAL